MSKLEELIKELCPDGVEYKTLGEVSKVTSGSSAPQNPSAFSEKGIPFCRTSDVGRVHLSVDFDNIADKITDSAAKKMTLMPKGTILIPKSGASTLLNHKVRLNVESYIVSHLAAVIPNKDEINDRYLYYALTRFDMGELVEDKSYPSVKTSDIAEKVTIPVPPLPVQQEIVRILDKFTELTTELTARKKQYEYYRDKLLSFDGIMNGGGYKKFFSVCDYIRGITYNKNDEINNGNSGIKVLRANNITLETNTLNYDDVKIVSSEVKIKENQWLKKGDILICAGSGSKEHIGKVAYIFNDMEYTFGGFMGVIRPNTENLKSRFLFHILTSNMFKKHLAKVSGATSSTINNINNDTWKGFVFPLPPLDVQERIVNVLDNFDAICSDLGIGLPAEIEKRRQQYEYYRDLLLTFSERGDTILTEQNRTEQNRTEQNRTEQNRTEQMR